MIYLIPSWGNLSQLEQAKMFVAGYVPNFVTISTSPKFNFNSIVLKGMIFFE